jgi:hypothetical protein
MLLMAAGTIALSHAAEVKSDAGRFAITAPVELKEQTKSVDGEEGKKIELHVFQGEKDGKAYFVVYSDRATDTAKQEDIEKLLDGARDGLIGGMKGKVTNETKIAMAGNAGRELDVDAKFNEIDSKVKARLYMVGKRLYQIMIVTPVGKGTPEEMVEFLNSFKLN